VFGHTIKVRDMLAKVTDDSNLFSQPHKRDLWLHLSSPSSSLWAFGSDILPESLQGIKKQEHVLCSSTSSEKPLDNCITALYSYKADTVLITAFLRPRTIWLWRQLEQASMLPLSSIGTS